MALFLTQAWVDAFNAALEGSGPALSGDVASLAAESGHVGVLQQVHDVPHATGSDGVVRTLLRIDDGAVRLSLVSAAAADVTVSLDYADAAAMARGELEPAQALGTGRIKVRGDLSVLLASQQVLTRSANRLRSLQELTTY